MKKPLLSLLAALFLMGTTATAQQLTFRYHGEDLAEGATVVIDAEENDFGELACYTNPESDPDYGLKLMVSGGLGAGTVAVKATMNFNWNTLNAETVKWCMGGLCYFIEHEVQTFQLNVNVPLREGEKVEFDAENIRSTGSLSALLTAQYNGVQRTVNILFNNNDPTLGIVNAQPSTLNPQRYYTLDGRKLSGKPATAGIYVVDGKKVVIK